MADVTARPDDRAQLLIVAAIGIAILLTVLALALNTAAYGGIHVAQTDNSLHEERAAVGYQHSVDRAVAGLITANGNTETEYDTLESDLRGDVDRWNDLTRREYAGDDAVTNASITDVTFESRIVQDETQPFSVQSNRSDRSNWTVVDTVSTVEAFELQIHNDSLVTDACPPGGDCFTLEVEGGAGETWRLFANATADGDGVRITVESPDGSTDTCETNESTASVNVTAGTFDDGSGPCSFTSFVDDDIDPPYTVRYVNADNVTGTYDLTVRGKVVEESIAEDDRYGTTGSPRIEAKIHSATVIVEYRSPDLTYRTEFQVDGGVDDE